MIRFVIPAYDEAPNMERLFARLGPAVAGLDASVVLVDDGSTDGTADLARRLGGGLRLRVIEHGVNRGLGAALDTGLRAVLEDAADDDAIVTIEGDGTSDLVDLPEMLARFAEGYDVVLASVHAPGGKLIGVAGWRVLASRAASTVVRWFGGLDDVHTVSAVYRCYRGVALRRIRDLHGADFIREPGFAVNVELLLKLKDSGATVCEVPTTNDWTQRAGASKLRTGQTLRAYARVLRRHRSTLRSQPELQPQLPAIASDEPR